MDNNLVLVGFRLATHDAFLAVSSLLSRITIKNQGINYLKEEYRKFFITIKSAFIFNIVTLEILEVSIEECIKLVDCDISYYDIDSYGNVNINLAGVSSDNLTKYIENGYHLYPMIYNDSVVFPCNTGDIETNNINYNSILITVYLNYNNLDSNENNPLYYFINLTDMGVYIGEFQFIAYSSLGNELGLIDYHCFYKKYLAIHLDTNSLHYISEHKNYIKIFDNVIIYDDCISSYIVLDNNVKSIGFYINPDSNHTFVVVPPSVKRISLLDTSLYNCYANTTFLLSKNIDVNKLIITSDDKLLDSSNFGSVIEYFREYNINLDFY